MEALCCDPEFAVLDFVESEGKETLSETRG